MTPFWMLFIVTVGTSIVTIVLDLKQRSQIRQLTAIIARKNNRIRRYQAALSQLQYKSSELDAKVRALEDPADWWR